MEKEYKLNPEQIQYMTIEDEHQSIHNVVKVNAHNWLYRLLHPNTEPEYKYIIKYKVFRHQYNYSIDEFFEDPDNDKNYMRPLIMDGVLQDNVLRTKSCVKIYYSDRDCFRKTFENTLDRDHWLKETGLDKVAESFINTTF